MERALNEVRGRALRFLRRNAVPKEHEAWIVSVERAEIEITDSVLETYSEKSGLSMARIRKKLDEWTEAFTSGRWCRRCGKRPKSKNARWLCGECMRNGSVSVFEPVASGGSAVASHSGGRVLTRGSDASKGGR